MAQDKKEYYKKYYQLNKDKIKSKNLKFYYKHKDRYKKYFKKYRLAHLDKFREYSKNFYYKQKRGQNV